MNATSLFLVRFHGISAAIGLLALFATGSALRAQTISMPYVTVGNPGNAGDPATASASGTFGSVSYTYDIGEYDVTYSQYCTFLNDVDPTGSNNLALFAPGGFLTLGIADAEDGISLNLGAANGEKYSVISGFASMPVVDVDYWSTLRFVNWMNNGEGNASTETGAYTLIGGNTDRYGTPSNASSLLANPQHNAGATVWLPNENEWYKAAYYDGANGTYSTYATQSNTAPGNIIGSGSNEANYYTGNGYSVTLSTSYSSGTNYLTAVGSFSGSASYYGTYDQSGDVYNWEATTVGSQYPVIRGGGWGDPGTLYVSSSFWSSTDPTDGNVGIGFRVASVPEPNSIMLMLAGVAGLALMRGKPFKL